MRWSIAKKLFGTFGIVSLLIFGVVTLIVVRMNDMELSQERTTQRDAVTEASYRTLSLVNQSNACVRGYAISIDDPVEGPRLQQNCPKILNQSAEAYADVKKLSEDFKNSENSALVNELTTSFPAFQAGQMKLVQDIGSRGTIGDTAKLEAVHVTNRNADEVRKDLKDVLDNLKKVTASETKVTAAQANQSILVAGAAGAFLIAFSLIVASIITRKISNQVHHLLQDASAIANGDLSQDDRIPETNDELGDLTLAMNHMRKSLTEVIGSVRGGAEQLATAAEEISASAGQFAASAEMERSETQHIATAMEEMSLAVLQVSQHSQQATQIAGAAEAEALAGGDIVSRTIEGIRSVDSSTGKTAAQMEELGRASTEISKITAVIEDIADQTNLLALNAAIEAARAGEQGRGFAVVADEVRKLAERTTTATKEIAAMVSTIQEKTGTAVTAMHSSMTQISVSVDKATEAESALKKIILGTSKVQEMIAQIATAATEQSSTTDEIERNMGRIRDIVQQSSVSAKESAGACESLSGLAFNLQQQVDRFKMRSDARTASPNTRPQSASYMAHRPPARDSAVQ